MKDIIISRKAIIREVLFFLGCLVFAECLNMFAIIKYSRPAIELISMIGYVLFTALLSYLILLLMRLLVKLIAFLLGHFL